jgi:dihydroorotate dehydrogenase
MEVYHLIKSGLFLLPPEEAHHLTLKMAELCPSLARLWSHSPHEMLRSHFFGKSWRSPLGLAAGLDKNAQALSFFDQIGFGSIECGTVTLKPQIGNPTPRMWRYPQELSLRNAMGFPNNGSEELKTKLLSRPKNCAIGVNIGKSKDSTANEAIDEYLNLYEMFANQSDWVTVNISSPNTLGLRDLQTNQWIEELLKKLIEARNIHKTPLLVKLAPDLADEELTSLTKTLANLGADGVIATNTTMIADRGIGGCSGRLLRVKAHQKRKVLLEVCRDRSLPLIGVGGFEDFKDVLAWWACGGELFQVYTAFVFQGPALINNLEKQMIRFLRRAGFSSINHFFELSMRDKQKIISSFGY